MLTATTKEEEAAGKALEGRTCDQCAHVRICMPFRAITLMMEQTYTDQTKPFEAKDLAKICEMCLSAGAVSTLTEVDK